MTASSSMAAQAQDDSGCSGSCKCGIAIAAVMIAVAIFLAVFFVLTSKDPVYSVTVTGVAGLDPTSSTNLSLSPVFNLTVRVDNARNRDGHGCIGRLSTVSVSYNDAVLGRGSVPQFCAKEGKVRERGARAWGQHVDLPQFLRDQLAGELAAGEAAVDVKVTTPEEVYSSGDTVFVCNQAKIGGGPARCRKESVYHHEQANPGSTD